jgi:type VI secretion system protein ImpF
MPAVINGSPMPLFDRLAAGSAPSSALLPDGASLRDSVARELSRLLNTRSRLGSEAFHQADGTVMDYGVPDFSSRSLQSAEDREAIAALVLRAITLYEPRLANATVRFVNPDSPTARPMLVIGGDLQVGATLGRVAFELTAHGQSAADPRWTHHG